MTDGARQVNEAVESISAVTQENNAAIEEISAGTEEMSAQVEAISADAVQIANTAAELRALVERFSIDAVTDQDVEFGFSDNVRTLKRAA